MANNPETVQWESGIYQIETADLVQGGVGGIDNAPHVLLGNRTAFLKNRLDAAAVQVSITPDVAQTQIIQAVVLHVPTVAALRNVPIPSIPNDRTVVIFARGLAADGDGAGGQYRWVFDSAAADDGELVLRPSSNPATGRWLKIGAATAVQSANLASGNNSNVAIARTTGFLDVTPVGGNATIVSFTAGFDGQLVTVTNLHATLRVTISSAGVRLPDNIVLLNKTAQTIRYSKTLGWIGA